MQLQPTRALIFFCLVTQAASSARLYRETLSVFSVGRDELKATVTAAEAVKSRKAATPSLSEKLHSRSEENLAFLFLGRAHSDQALLLYDSQRSLPTQLSSHSMPTKMQPSILVVGGGFAGRAAVRYFLDRVEQAHIVLIDEKPFFEFTPSTLRCIVYPGHISRITFSQYSDPDFTFLQGHVTCMTEREATVVRQENERAAVFSVPYDYCVWATGVDYAPPIRSPHWRRNPTILTRRGEFGFFRHRVLAASEYVSAQSVPILRMELKCSRFTDCFRFIATSVEC